MHYRYCTIFNQLSILFILYICYLSPHSDGLCRKERCWRTSWIQFVKSFEETKSEWIQRWLWCTLAFKDGNCRFHQLYWSCQSYSKPQPVLCYNRWVEEDLWSSSSKRRLERIFQWYWRYRQNRIQSYSQMATSSQKGIFSFNYVPK